MATLLALGLSGCGFSEVQTKRQDGAAPPDLLGGGADLASSDLTSPHLHVFVTSITVSGDMNGSMGGAPGLLGADLVCVQLASAGHLGTSFRAWLSDSQTHAIDRVLGDGPWYRTDETMAFSNRAQLLKGPLAYLDLDEMGRSVVIDSGVWTGTDSSGVAKSGQLCRDWTSTSASDLGDQGITDAITTGWTDSSVDDCNGIGKLYCFESP